MGVRLKLFQTVQQHQDTDQLAARHLRHLHLQSCDANEQHQGSGQRTDRQLEHFQLCGANEPSGCTGVGLSLRPIQDVHWQLRHASEQSQPTKAKPMSGSSKGSCNQHVSHTPRKSRRCVLHMVMQVSKPQAQMNSHNQVQILQFLGLPTCNCVESKRSRQHIVSQLLDELQ